MGLGISSFAPTQTTPILKGLPKVGCDLPEDGGISGTLGKFNKPMPGACEERPTTYDWKTGQNVYLDEYLKNLNNPHVCYMA